MIAIVTKSPMSDVWRGLISELLSTLSNKNTKKCDVKNDCAKLLRHHRKLITISIICAVSY